MLSWHVWTQVQWTSFILLYLHVWTHTSVESLEDIVQTPSREQVWKGLGWLCLSDFGVITWPSSNLYIISVCDLDVNNNFQSHELVISWKASISISISIWGTPARLLPVLLNKPRFKHLNQASVRSYRKKMLTITNIPLILELKSGAAKQVHGLFFGTEITTKWAGSK